MYYWRLSYDIHSNEGVDSTEAMNLPITGTDFKTLYTPILDITFLTYLSQSALLEL